MHYGQEGGIAKPFQRHMQGVVWMDVDEGRPTENASDRQSALPLDGGPLQHILGDPVPFSVTILDEEKLS